jgi:hypothetical protein
MHILRTLFLSLLLLIISTTAWNQSSNINFRIESWAGCTTNGQVPFWLRSNQFGSIPISGHSVSLIASVKKDYALGKEKLFDWGFSAEGRGNLGQSSNLRLIEGYGKVKLSIFELRTGRSKKITGLCDTTLTSGSWAISGTNLGIPEIELSVRNFWIVPWLGQLFAFKGNYSHGWLGDVQMERYILQDTLKLGAYLHQKSLYGRFGKPSWRVKLYGGFNHQVVWGHEQEYYLDDYTLTPLETYFYVITGKKFSNGYIQQERQGNHLGSIDLGLEYRFDKVTLLAYRQSIYEGGALAHLANIEDGLNGFSIVNNQATETAPFWKKFLLEFLYTKKQSKGSWSPDPTKMHYESYYNHGQYIDGWSYHGSVLGTPFIGTREFIRKDLASDPGDFFINNRVMVIHLGGEGAIKNINYLFKVSWSDNFGTYLTASPEDAEGLEYAGEYGVFGERQQLSTYLQLNRTLRNGLNLGLIGAFDVGALYYNSFGLFLTASYSFSL